MSQNKRQPDKPRRAGQPADVEQLCSVLASIALRLTQTGKPKTPRRERKRGDD